MQEILSRSHHIQIKLFKRSRQLLVAVLMTLLCIGVGCQSKRSADTIPQQSSVSDNDEKPPVIFVSNAFLADVVKALAGPKVDLLWLLPKNADPISWSPTAVDLEKMQRAQLLVLNGANFEPWVASVALPSSRMLRTANDFRDQWIETAGVIHAHGPGGEHSHAGIASTTWLDFELAVLQAKAVCNRLKLVIPESSRALKANFGVLENQLLELDEQMRQLASELGQRPILVSHPFHQYWARRYGINAKAVNWDSTEVIGSNGLQELKSVLRDFPAGIFLWETEPKKENIEALNAHGLKSAVFCPAANLSESESWLAVMKNNLQNLQQVMR